MDLELNGKTAIVTGGSRGIGKATARELAREGVDVAIVARGRPELQATAKELAEETGRRIIAITADTGNEESVQSMVQQAATAMGHLDILVNCAARVGGGPAPGLADITEQYFWEDMNVKVMGYLRCAREVAPYMQQQGWGRIINVSGMAARQAGSTVGSIRNVAVAAMTKNLGDELGPFGINVTVVHPGLTWTERIPDFVNEQAASQGITTDEVERNLAESNSVRRIIDAREIAYVITFLASPKSVSINGDNIATGGGVGKGIHY